jgi:hypothetical protein
MVGEKWRPEAEGSVGLMRPAALMRGDAGFMAMVRKITRVESFICGFL